MNVIKRMLCIGLILVLAIALCACGKKKTDNGSDKQDSGITTTTTKDDWANNMDDNLFNDGELDWG